MYAIIQQKNAHFLDLSNKNGTDVHTDKVYIYKKKHCIEGIG